MMEVGVMPRKQITFNPIIESHTGPTVDGVPSATVNIEQARRNVHVSWHRGDCAQQPTVTGPCTGWVQLGIDVTIGELRSMLADAETMAQAEARKQADIGALDMEAFQFRVYSDVLSRSEANTAVQALRSARDVAYGRDA